MADRRVSVYIRAEVSQYKRELAEAAVATDRFGRSVDDSGKSIDKLSGRLRLLTDAALTLGPALIPLGAAGIGGIVAMAAQLGALAGAAGVTLLALNGVGDGLKALDKYQLEPTAANLEKLNQAMKNLGPSGADFVHYLDSIEGDLSSLQMAARDGLFPGVEEGIDALLQRLPQVRDLIREFASVMGGQAADAGAALGGQRFDAFFHYLETDGVRILDDTARTIGNLTEAVANLFVGFGGISTDWSGGLLDFSENIAEASRDLENNDGFQDFLAYIEQSGPQALDALGAIGNALLQIVEAAAPLGGPVLRIIEGFAKALAAIADSPIGTPLFTAIAALTAFSRLAGLATKASDSLRTSLDMVATSGEKTRSTLSKIGSTAGGIAAVGIAVGALADGVARIDAGNLDRSLQALAGGDVTGDIDQIVTSLENLTATRNKVDLGELVTVGGLFGDTSLDKYADNIKAVDAALAGMVESGDVAQAKETFAALQAQFEAAGISSVRAAEYFEQYKTALSNAGLDGFAGILGSVSNALGGFGGFANNAAVETETLAASIEDATAAMHDMRQEALRAANAELDYRQAIDDANAAVKENGKNHDKTTEKGRANLRALYNLAGAWNGQSEVIKGNSKKLAEARENFIKTAGSMGISAAAARKLSRDLFDIPEKRQTKITAETAQAEAALRSVRGILASLNDKTINVRVNRYSTSSGGPGIMRADGGTVPGQRHPYGDKMMILAAPGEEIISNRHGQADRFRADRAAGRIPGYADGGTAGGGRAGFSGSPVRHNQVVDNALHVWVDGAYSAAKALKTFKAELNAAEKSVDKEKKQRDELISAQQAFMSSVSGAFSKADLFTGGLSDFDTAVQANTNDTNAAQAALAQAAANGLNGPLFQALAASGNLTLLQEFAGLSAAEIDRREQMFAGQSNAQAGLGSSASALAGFDAAIKEQTKELREAQRERKLLNAAVKKMEARLDKLPDKVEDGARKGVSERERRTAANARAGR